MNVVHWQPGDTIIVTCEEVLGERAKEVVAEMEKLFPDAKCVVMDGGLKVECWRMRKAEPLNDSS